MTERARQRQRGATLIELLIVATVAAMLASMAVPSMKRSLLKSKVNVAAAESKSIHASFTAYYLDNGSYPDAAATLVTSGYFRASGSSIIDSSRSTYGSPDDQGENQEFWLRLELEADSEVVFLVANSNDTPFGAGDEYDGIFLFHRDTLIPIEKFQP